MRKTILSLIVCVFALASIAATDALAIPRGDNGKAKSSSKKDKNGDEGKDFKKVIKDFRKVEGLFDLYIKDKTGDIYIAIKPDQLGKVYLCGITRNAGDGSFYDSGSMGGEFPFMFKRVGEKIQMLMENVLVRADEDAAISRAIERGLSNSLYASGKVVKSKPGPDDEILIDAANFFLHDVSNTGYFLGSMGKTGFSFDKSNSHFGDCKSFPENTELNVNLYFKTSKPNNAMYLMSPYSMIHTYHFSLSTLPETGYRPRIADDRVGHFLTLFQDYTNLDNDQAYVRYVSRWHLEKEEPYADLSKPVTPITFWLENTIPEEYRKAVGEGVLYWNKSFEKIGFKDAIVVKQQPDDADWDPADVRYNTVRWMIMPGAGYAVGPSRTNPYTGQIYDADIRISSDFIRYMFNYVETSVKPIAFGPDGNPPEQEWESFYNTLRPEQKQRFCNYGHESAMEAGYAHSILLARNTFDDKDEVTKKFVQQYIIDLVSHEVGHTLGFRHNFKSSTFNTAANLADAEYTLKNGLTGTVMDYSPANIAPEGTKQGEFFQTTPGPYDDWVIEYAYAQLEATSTEGELAELDKLASRGAEHGLQYGTDEDALGGSVRSIDPTCNYFDMGADPFEYYTGRTGMTDELWQKMEAYFEKDGANYAKLRRVFSSGWRGYRDAGGNIAKFVGGYYHNRAHVGDAGSTVPFTPVEASKQRAAIDFINAKIFSSDAFDLPARTLNKLQPERFPDFAWSVYTMPRIDYPLHDAVLNIQRTALFKLYASTTLKRVNDQEMRFTGSDKFTMEEMFRSLRRGIWTELQGDDNVNSFRRNLQLEHLNVLKTVYLNIAGTFPEDARTLALNDMNVLSVAIGNILSRGAVNSMTANHLKRVNSEIAAVTNATVMRK